MSEPPDDEHILLEQIELASHLPSFAEDPFSDEGSASQEVEHVEPARFVRPTDQIDEERAEVLPTRDVRSEHGIAASLPRRAARTIFAAPTVTREHNTVVLPLHPVACARIEEPRFEAGTSFLRASSRAEMARLAALWRGLPGRTAAVFGHFDSAPGDEPNKALSDRRALAVYGLLVRDAALWDELWSRPFGSDNWGIRAAQIALGATGHDPGDVDTILGPRTEGAIRGLQSERGLPVTGHLDAATRQALFLAYMDVVCRDEDGAPFVLASSDFLGRGEDPGRKGDVQGCGAHNPVLVFSEEEEAALRRGDGDRAMESAPNRRVVVYLFEGGPRLVLDKWPCPRAGEGALGCAPSLWADAARRRSPGPEHRVHASTTDTFGCAFYDRLARRSPCESVPSRLQITLFDQALRLMPHARYRLWLTGAPRRDPPDREGIADGHGRLVEMGAPTTGRCFIEWAPFGMSGRRARFPFRTSLDLGIATSREDAAQADKRLRNMGYHRLADTFKERLALFQDDYRVDVAEGARGELDSVTEKALRDAHDQGLPKPV